jgi:hypothetical protein
MINRLETAGFERISARAMLKEIAQAEKSGKLLQALGFS